MDHKKEHTAIAEYAEEYTCNILAELHSLVPLVIKPSHQHHAQAKAVFIEACHEFLNSEQIKATLCPILYEVYVSAINRCLASFYPAGAHLSESTRR